MIKVKRVYDPPSRSDGKRVLIDRLWPRGLKKQEADIDAWMKDVAPSAGLRKWFAHDPGKWSEFKKRYYAELARNRDALGPLVEMARRGNVTLLYASKEEQFNNATALKEYLESRSSQPAGKRAA